MVLVSFVLVVVAAITLVIGLLQSGLGIIYVSIACSVLAGIVLFIAVLRGRPEPRVAGAPGAARPAPAGAPPAPAPAETSWRPTAPTAEAEAEPAPAPPPPPPPPPSEREPVLAGVGAGAVAAADAGVGDRTEQLDQAAIEEAVATDDGFPIHNYDRLRATEILPMLADLDDEQLQAVRRREEAGKNRFMILSRIDDEVQARSSETWAVDEEAPEGEPELVGEPVDAGGPGPVPVGRRRPAGEFPIPDYDSRRALDVLGRLNDLSPDELRQVREREQAGPRRAMVLNRIDRILEETGPLPAEPLVVPPPEAEPAPARRRGRAAKAPAAKAPAAKKAAGRAAKAAKAAKGTRAAKVVAAPEAAPAPVRKVAGAKKARAKKVTAEAPPTPTKRTGAKRGAAAAPAGPESAAPAAKRVRKVAPAKKTVAKKATKAAGGVKRTVRKR